VRTRCGKEIGYKRVCVTTGGAPKLIAKDHPLVLGIRDTESVKVLQEKIRGARRIMIVGNGGIATELV
jgi:small subunit ribosomal protein S18b